MTRNFCRPRRGAALVLVLVCMAVLAVMMTAVVQNGLMHNRGLARREHQQQAYWLAQAGIEHAAARLLTGAADYKGETLEIVPRSKVRIVAQPVEKSPDVFLVTCEAVFPQHDTASASCTASRTFKLKRQEGKNVLEALRN